MWSVTARFFRVLKKNRKILFCWLFSLLLLWVSVLSVFPSFTYAQANVPTTGWVQDPEVTLVGKAAERARQLLWWTIRNPGVYSAPVLAEYWSISRNIVYVFTLIVIVGFGLSYILLRRRASMSTITPILFKIAFVLLFATFSYVLLLALIQFSEIAMRFFIEQVGGRDLFNVIFSGAGGATKDPFESNYYNFVGYRKIDAANQEMVQTSLFLIRFTTFTYYVMSIMLILRTIILWFLLVLSPFLVLLLPFIFIRNTGFIWIGVFFQWLFYGPLVAVFLGAITKIWVKGIPFPFDFGRAGKINGQIYQTSINILYGGPAQQLGPANSANYIDTFAEYIISLIMLWTAIILPWLLLRIFRDYCCIAIAAGNATLTAIYDRLRQYPSPTPPTTTPGSPAATAVDLPFRQTVNQNMNISAPARVEMIKEIEKTNTEELTKTLNLSVSKLADISRIETNQYAQSQIRQQLATLAIPESAVSSTEKERFTLLRQELQSRAAAGDRQARILLNASGHRNDNLSATVNVVIENRNEKSQDRELAREREVERERSEKVSTSRVSDMIRLNPNIAHDIAQSTQVSESTVSTVLQSIPVGGKGISEHNIAVLSKEHNLSESKVNQIVNEAQSRTEIIESHPTVTQISQKVNLSESTVRGVLENIPINQVVDQGTVSQVALKLGISAQKVEEIYQTAQPTELITVSMSPSSIVHMVDASSISKKVNIDQKKVEKILQKLPLIEIISHEIIRSISEATGVPKSTIEEIYKISVNSMSVPESSVIAQKAQTTESVVSTVLPLIPKSQSIKETQFEQTAKEVNTTKENVKAVYQKTQISIYEVVPQMASQIAERLNLDNDKVVKALSVLPTWGTPSTNTLKKASEDSELPQEKVKEIAKIAMLSLFGNVQQSIEEIVQSTGESETIVQTVLGALPKIGFPTPSKIAEVAKKSAISEARVRAIVTASHTASTKPNASGIASTISLEDYEEVKKMWLNHYRSAPVPVNETIKDRNGWLTYEHKKLQSVSELISSQDPKVKEQGLEKVSEILPFLLLGGFSDAEILTYVKAKQEAVKQVTDELNLASTTREETAKKIAAEDESTMIGITNKDETVVSVADTLSESFSDEEVPVVSTGSGIPLESSQKTESAPASSKSAVQMKSWIRNIHALKTPDIAANLNLGVNRLKDILGPEINKEKHENTLKNLTNISSPGRITDLSQRSDFENVRSELEERATAGDIVAQRILTASNNIPGDVTPAASFILVSNRKGQGIVPDRKITGFSIYERALKDPSVTPYLATKNSIPEPLVYQVIEFIAEGGEVTDEKINNISQQVNLPVSVVKEIISGASQLLQINTLTPTDIAVRVALPAKKVKAVLEKIPTDHQMTPSEQEELAKSSGISIFQMMSIDEFTRQPIERYASSLIPFIAESYSVPDASLRSLFHAVPAYTILTPEKIEDLGTEYTIKPATLRQILETVDESFVVKSDPYVFGIAKSANEPVKTVQSVVEAIPTVGNLSSIKRANLAEETATTSSGVAKIEKLLETQKKESELLPSSVTIDDYEEVKNMWLNHYNNSPVPVNDKIKNRFGWIVAEEKQIQAVSELLSASDPKEKQKGLEKISEILPYMLLGGFSDVEMLTFLKAKYQAAREVRTGMESNVENPEDPTLVSAIEKPSVLSQNVKSDMQEEMPAEKKVLPDSTLSTPAPTAIVDQGPVRKKS